MADEISELDTIIQSTMPVVLTEQQRNWVDYNALSGLITDLSGTGKFNDEGQEMTLRKMPITEFSKLIGVSRETLRQWRMTIPGFWDLVEQRRQELAPQSRVQMFHEKWYLAALSMKNWQVSEAWAMNFLPNYQSPKLKLEHEAGDSWAALYGHKRNVIEGQVSDDSNRT